MKTMIVIPGRSSGRLRNQVRYVAKQLAEDGRVLVVFTSRPTDEVVLPGQATSSTVLGNAPSGYPLWTGRMSAALGIRRRQGSTIIWLFDGANRYLALAAAIVARARREHVIVHNDDHLSGEHSGAKLARRALQRLAHATTTSSIDHTEGERKIAVAVCGDDHNFTELMIAAVNGLADEAAAGWRFVVHVGDGCDLPEPSQLRRPDAVRIERGAPDHALLMMSDVVVVPDGIGGLAELANHYAAAGVIVGHPAAERMMRRFDGVWLARDEVSSLLVTLESASHEFADGHVSAPTLRATGDGIVSAVQALRSPV